MTKQKYHSIEVTGGDLEAILQEAEGEAEVPDATSFDQKVVSSALYDCPRSVANVDTGQDGSGGAATISPSHQASSSNGTPAVRGDPGSTAAAQTVAPGVGNTNMPMEDQELKGQEVTIQVCKFQNCLKRLGFDNPRTGDPGRSCQLGRREPPKNSSQ